MNYRDKLPLKLVVMIQEAVDHDDAVLAGEAVETMRFKHKMNYSQCRLAFADIAGCSVPNFEDLMFEADGDDF